MRERALGPYLLDRELGAGGMGKVHAAQVTSADLGLEPGTRVAVKVIHPHLVESPAFFERFLREAEIGAAIRHENVVATHGAGTAEADGTRHHYLVMELVEGQTLRSLLRELERVPEELCRHVGREVAKGLAAIHAAGVLHRDVKPENVLITSDHRVKVMDLGVARLQDEAVRLSQTGAFVGSIHYAAPESLRERGRHVDGRADLHALGLVLYELSTGVSPYFAEDVPQVLMKVLHESPRRLGDANPQISPFFEEVVHCLLAKNPEERFPDAMTLCAALGEGEASAWWSERAKAIRAATHRPLRRIRIPRETAVYGRETEIARLRALYGKAKAGEGQVVLIEGEAGIGKSRLVDELVGRLQRDGEDLDFLFGSYPPGGAAMAAEAFGTAFREHLGDADLEAELRARLGPAASLAPAFAALLLARAAPGGSEALTRESLHACFVMVARSLAAERTTVLLIDDLHFATDEGRALFTSLALAAAGHRLVLVGTTRPGIDERWLAGLTRLPQASHVTIGRLGPKDLSLLLADSLRSEQLAAQLSRRIAVKSDGNPFFAFEIIDGLREGHFITQREDGAWMSTGAIEEIRIPSSVLDLVKARVADLTQEERDLLDVASCWGYEFDPLLVADVVGLARVPLLKIMSRIERKHRLVRSAGRRFVFDHHQVQEALYEGLPELLRESHHAALAESLERSTRAAEADPAALDGGLCVDLSEHHLKGARGASALRYLPCARAHLRKSYRNAQLIDLIERALAVPGLLSGVERADALLGLGEALDLLGRRVRQEECAREAESLAAEAGDAGLLLRAAMALGTFFSRTSRAREAAEAHRRALQLAQALGDRKAEAAATLGLGSDLASEDRLPEARVHDERALAICLEIGHREGEAMATGSLGLIAARLGRFAEAKEHYERALAIHAAIGSRTGEATCTGNLGNVFHGQGRFAEARACFERQLSICREIGHRHGEAAATVNLGNVFHALGRAADAKEHYERGVALSREIGQRVFEANATGSLGIVVQLQGRLREAREQHERRLGLVREIGDRLGEAGTLQHLGHVLREEGDVRASEACFESSLAICEAIGHRELEATARLALGFLRAATGDVARAREALEAARDLARTVGLPGTELLGRCKLAVLPGGEPSDALAAFAEREELLDAEELREARLLLWQVTGDRAHLAEAKRLLDASVAQADEEARGLMLTRLRVNREIVEACRELGLD